MNECTVSVDEQIYTSCEIQVCNGGFNGVLVDCSNVEEGAIYDDCDATLNGGDLLWFFAPQ